MSVYRSVKIVQTETSPTCNVFVASSVEALPAAHEMQVQLQYDCPARVWPQDNFPPGDFTLSSLTKAILNADFVVCLFTPDDEVIGRNGAKTVAPRDNVVFEAGLAVGLLGKERVIVVVDRAHTVKFPSDLGGLNIATFDSRQALPQALGPACNEVRKAVSRLGPRPKIVSDLASDGIVNEDLRRFGVSLVEDTARSIRALAAAPPAKSPEADYMKYLLDEVRSLVSGDRILAICGGKNYKLDEVYWYLNENVRLARDRGVHVNRLYVAPDGNFDAKVLDVVHAHLNWSAKVPAFRVAVLMGECEQLINLQLPRAFGLVLTEHQKTWKGRIHFGLDDKTQDGWTFTDEHVITKLIGMHRILELRANQSDMRDRVRARLLKEGLTLDPRLWRLDDPPSPKYFGPD